MAKSQIAIEIIGDNANLRKELADTTRRLKGFERRASQTGTASKSIFDPLKKNVAGLNGAMGQTTGRFQSITKAGKGLTGPMVGAAVGFAAVAEAVQFVGEGFDKLKRLTAETKLLENATGMSAETSSAWVGVSRRFGLSAQQVTTGLGIMSKQMVTAGEDTEAGAKKMELFARAGLSPAILKSRDMDRTLIAVANKFKAMPNGVDKTDLAMRLFGRSGRQLIPVLNQGGDKLKVLKDEMGKLGLTINDKTKKQVVDLTRAQKKLRDLWDGVQIQLATKLIPRFSAFASAASEAAVGIRSGVKPAGALAGKLYDIADAFRSIYEILKKLNKFNDLLKKIDPATRVGTAIWNLGKKLKFFASGGIVNGAQLAMIGEAGPEAVIPLSRKYRAQGADLYAKAGQALGMSSGGHTFNITNVGNALDEQQLASRMAWQLSTRSAV